MKVNRKPVLKITMALAALALFVFAVPGHATVILDFSTGDAGAGGTILTSGGNAAGTGIAIDSLTVSGDGAFNGVYDVDGTANGTGELLVGSLAFSTASNFVQIVGAIPSLGISTAETLASGTGTFSSVSVVAGAILISVAFNTPDQKAADLLTALGVSPTTPFLLAALNINGFSNAPAAGYTANSTDLENVAVPEPASLFLMGSGLLALGMLLRKKLAIVQPVLRL